MRARLYRRPTPAPEFHRRRWRPSYDLSWLYDRPTQQLVTIAQREITAATKANPCVLTVTAHNLVNGNVGRIWDVGGMVEINDQSFLLTVVDANHVSLPVNSTAYTTYTSGGVLAWGRSTLEHASPAAVDDDIEVLSLLSTPGNYTVDARADGGITINALGDAARQIVYRRFYDRSLSAFSDPAMVPYYDGNHAPEPNDADPIIVYFLPVGFPVTPAIDLRTLAHDADSDAFDVTETTGGANDYADTGGMTLTSSIVGGTPTIAGPFEIMHRWRDVAGDFFDALVIFLNGNFTVPNVVGETTDTATTDLNTLYFSATYTYAQSNTVAFGLVISQNPVAGAVVPPVTNVTLLISTGGALDLQPATASAPTGSATGAAVAVGAIGTATASAPTALAGASSTVPNVVGMTQAAATTAILTAGFFVGNVAPVYSSTVLLGLVVSQSPPTSVQIVGTNVDLTVSLGPAPIPPPPPTPGLFPDALPGLTFAGARRFLWKTTLQEALSSKTTAIGLMQYPIIAWELKYELLRDDLSASELRKIFGLVNAQQGRSGTFLYFDSLFNTAALEPFGVGNNTRTKWQLVAAFQNVGGPGKPEIIQNFNGTPVIFDNGVLVSAATYAISATGIVTFNTPPVNAHVLTWSGGFLYRCKFLTDATDFNQLMQQWWEARAIKFRSIIL